ncbi:MAG: hypothetical protein PHN69_06060 [Candidatus Pacebacteria bacterium]|nr:hypothetical protein [Candidatus Paceibacterota bacterium]
MIDVINAFPSAALILSAVAFAYLWFNFLSALTIHPGAVAQLDQEFAKADEKLEELRQNGEKDDGRDGAKINQ